MRWSIGWRSVVSVSGGEGALFGVDRLALTAIDGDECTGKEVQLRTQHRALTANLSQGLQVVLPEVRNRLVIRSQRLSQPHPFDMPMGLLLQATTRTETGE